jgi:hypothetical protein
MTAPGSGWLRYARATTVASIAVTLSVAGHVLGGGHSPHPLAVGVLIALATIPGYLLGRRRLSRAALAGLLAAVQFTIHLALSSTTASTAHHHDLAGSDAVSSASPSPLLMLTGHVLATIALSLLLATGETLLWRLWAWMSACWPRRPRPVARSARTARAVSVWFVRTRTSDWHGRQAAPRGPPRAVGLVAA